jgi:hypothetical protein
MGLSITVQMRSIPMSTHMITITSMSTNAAIKGKPWVVRNKPRRLKPGQKIREVFVASLYYKLL